jgi:hypothetical protein
MSLRAASTPIDLPVPKLGGQPVWLDEPFWPISRSLSTMMTFVGQIPIPGEQLRMSYLFVAYDDLGAIDAYDPTGGENALVVQPGGRIPDFVTGTLATTGPSLWRRGAHWDDRVPVEYEVDLEPLRAADEEQLDREIDYGEAERAGVFLAEIPFGPPSPRSYVGGRPRFWQPTTLNIAGPWRFLFQLDGGEGWLDDPYALNFGGGTGYAFVSPDEMEGRFYWDCV